MLDHLRSEAGHLDRVKLLSDQRLLSGVPVAAGLLASRVTLSEYANGKQVYVQDDPVQRILYLVLGGSVALRQDTKLIVTLGPGQFFGEFPLLDPTARYLLSVTSSDITVIATLPWDDFSNIATRYPAIWQNMAAELARRLRNSNVSVSLPQDSEAPKSFQEGGVRYFYSLGKRSRAVLLAVAAVGAAAYFIWTSFPEATRTLFLVRAGLIAPAAPSTPVK